MRRPRNQNALEQGGGRQHARRPRLRVASVADALREPLDEMRRAEGAESGHPSRQASVGATSPPSPAPARPLFRSYRLEDLSLRATRAETAASIGPRTG